MSVVPSGRLSKKLIQNPVDGCGEAEGMEGLPLPRCTLPQGEVEPIFHENLVDRRARKIREVGYKNILSEGKCGKERSEC